MKKLLALLMAGGLSTLLIAQTGSEEREGAGGIIFGPAFSFALGAPQGWIFDTELAPAIGARAAIYPKGEDLTTTQVLIHANAFPLENMTLSQWIEGDIAQLKQEFPGIKVKALPSLQTADSLTAMVREFDPSRSSYELIERIAYIRIDDHVAVVSLSARNRKAYDGSIDAFTYVVEGFSNFQEKIRQQKD